MSELEAVEVEAGQEEVPSWVDDMPDKFRGNPAALIDAYRNLESRLTTSQQQLREQTDQFEAYLAEEIEAEPVAPQGRGQTLAQMQRLAEESAYMGAQRVVGAISAGRVPAPEDPKQLAKVASEMMVSLDPAWAATDPKLVASVLDSRPELLGEGAAWGSAVCRQ